MSNVKFFNFNLAVQETTDLTASSENGFFPATNIKDPRTTKEWRSVTGVNSASIIFDLKTEEEVDSVLMKGHHFDGFGFTSVTVEANITSDFSSPAFSTTLSPDFKFNYAFKTLSPSQTYRFWRVVVSGSGNFVSIANIFIGKAVQLTTNNIDFGWTLTDSDFSKVQRNRFNQEFIDKIGRQKNFGNMQFRLLNKTEVDSIFGIYDENGITEPIWTIIDEDGNIINEANRFLLYARLTAVPQVTNAAFSLYDSTMTLREVI